jgi:hypothetical protein
MLEFITWIRTRTTHNLEKCYHRGRKDRAEADDAGAEHHDQSSSCSEEPYSVLQSQEGLGAGQPRTFIKHFSNFADFGTGQTSYFYLLKLLLWQGIFGGTLRNDCGIFNGVTCGRCLRMCNDEMMIIRSIWSIWNGYQRKCFH